MRRVRVQAKQISADPRSRRRRTIDPNPLALALDGAATHAYAVSLIVTNIPANDAPSDTHRCRPEHRAGGGWSVDAPTSRTGSSRPSSAPDFVTSPPAAQREWSLDEAALLAGNLSVLLQALTGIDDNGG